MSFALSLLGFVFIENYSFLIWAEIYIIGWAIIFVTDILFPINKIANKIAHSKKGLLPNTISSILSNILTPLICFAICIIEVTVINNRIDEEYKEKNEQCIATNIQFNEIQNNYQSIIDIYENQENNLKEMKKRIEFGDDEIKKLQIEYADLEDSICILQNKINKKQHKFETESIYTNNFIALKESIDKLSNVMNSQKESMSMIFDDIEEIKKSNAKVNNNIILTEKSIEEIKGTLAETNKIKIRVEKNLKTKMRELNDIDNSRPQIKSLFDSLIGWCLIVGFLSSMFFHGIYPREE